MLEQWDLLEARRTRRQVVVARATSLLEAARAGRPPIDVERLARLVGIVRIETAFLSSSDACLIPGRNGHTVLVDERASPRRRRFSIAHEIGHVLLRSHGVKFRGSSQDRHAWEERTCDKIADELLMPTHLFTEKLQGRPRSIETLERLANTFETAIEPTAIKFGNTCNDVGVVFWRVQGNTLQQKWRTGRTSARLEQTHDAKDMTFGPAISLCAEEPITSYGMSPSGSDLGLEFESKSYPGLYPFVITIIREEIQGRSEMAGRLSPGEKAPRSGQYEIVGPKGGRTGEERTVTRGEPLPPPPDKGQKYVLVDPTKHKSGR